MPVPLTAPHAHRERAYKGHKASTGSVAVHAKPADPTAGTAPPASTEGGSTTAATPSPTLGTPQVRRGRPVTGIGRHFEAALSGAIGGGGSGSNGERKRRGEKEKDKEGGAPLLTHLAQPAEALCLRGRVQAGERGNAATMPRVGDTKNGKSGTAAVPNILQRSDAINYCGRSINRSPPKISPRPG